jgi:hypothetical protein
MVQYCEIQQELALVVYLRDVYSGKAAVGWTDVSLINEDGSEATKGKANPSNYYVFLQMPNVYKSIRVKSEFYHDKIIVLDEPVEKTKRIELFPKPSYPFRSGETLARGILPESCDISYSIIEGSDFVVSIKPGGEFVIWFKNICYDNLVKVNKQFLMQKINFEISGKSYYIDNIEVGKTNSAKPIPIDKKKK